MKKYVFLTGSITGFTGNPRYVDYKCGWLKQHGWDPVVFWSLDNAPVKLEHVRLFCDKKFIHHELVYFPSWFTKRKRDRVVDDIISAIGSADQIIIESNLMKMMAWGELIAEKLKIKHIVFLTSEGLSIKRKETFDFCYAKLQRGELFTINPQAVKLLFSNFTTIPEPTKYFWSATMGVEVDFYQFPPFDRLPESDYTITHFGRSKGYFPKMIEELKMFFSCHLDKTFNLFFLGDVNEIESIKHALDISNVRVFHHPAVPIVPKQVFTKSDLIIATAGCASLSANNGGKTISMDIFRNVPLGLLHYTTLDRNIDSGKYHNDKSLSQWLETLLIENIEYSKMDFTRLSHSFDYQMQYVTNPDGVYFDTTKIRERISHNDLFWIPLTKIGLFSVVDYVYFLKIKLKRAFIKR